MKFAKPIFIYKDLIVLLGCIFLFLLLLFKDPFSQRTLIPNFEPYPDTFYYINPALSFVKGEGFNIQREGRIIKKNVPPLYGFSLVPLFLANPDPRMSYYTNLILSLSSMLLFWLILRKIFINKFILYSLLILYVTNYFIYWFPSVIMAENLVLTLYLAAFYFLLSGISLHSLIIIPMLSVGLYATKFAAIPITAAVIFLFLIRIFSLKLKMKYTLRLTLFFLLEVFFLFGIFAILEQIFRGNNVLSPIFGHLSLIYQSLDDNVDYENSEKFNWFSIQYLITNLPLYLNSLIGNPNRFLWDNTPIIPKFVAIGAILGIFISLFNRKFNFLSLMLLFFISSLIIFMSTFYSFDGRYIYIAIPTLIIGFGLLLVKFQESFFRGEKIIFSILILIFISIYFATNFTRVKSQISLNLKYAENPWYYIAVLKMNEFFTNDKVVNGKTPILISALPPFLVDYFTNGNYTLLPLSYEQEFRGQAVREIVWGPNDYSDLPKLYRKYLNEGYDLYVSRAGLGNEYHTNRDFNTIVNDFETMLVQPGCFEQCNIYRVKLK